MNGRALVLRYAWRIAFDEALRSQRWSGQAKLALAMSLGPVLGAISVGSWLWWVVTGHAGPLFRLFGHGSIVVMPFPKAIPREVREQLDELRERAGPEFEAMRAEAEQHAARARRQGA